MTNVNELFDTAESGEETKGARALEGTAQLTNISREIVNTILLKLNDNLEENRAMLTASKEDHGAMDMLINALYPIANVDVTFLKELDATVLENMLRSQQSKRSRSKSKAMTMENYRNMMTGAVGENLLRFAMGKAKSLTFGTRHAGKSDFTDEEIAEMAKDQGDLRREIRNVQSKKSIMKAKEGFSEESDAWKQLCDVEARLKAARVEWTAEPKPDKTKGALAEMLDNVEPDSMKAADLKELLARIKELA